MGTLSGHLQSVDAAISAHARGRPVYLYIPEPNKSYGVLAMNYRNLPNPTATTIINGPQHLQQLMKTPGHPLAQPQTTLLVIIDDVAGSGGSLDKAFRAIATPSTPSGSASPAPLPYTGEVMVFPQVASKDAHALFANTTPEPGAPPPLGSYAQPGSTPSLHFTSQMQVKSILESEFYRHLPADQRTLLNRILRIPPGHKPGDPLNLSRRNRPLGWEHGGLQVVFPYMAPNNNHVFFSKTIAPHFVSQKATGSVKNSHRKHALPED